MGGPVLRGILGARVDGDRTASAVLRADHHAHLDAALLGQHQRCGQRQFLQRRAAHGLAGRQGQFHQYGAGQQGAAQDHVVGQPRLRLNRQPARQHHTTGVRQRHHRTQQRMIGRVQTGAGGSRGGAVRGVQPVALPLEGVGRQVDGVCAGAGEVRGPVDGSAVAVQVSEGGEQGVGLVPALAGDRHQQDIGVVETGTGHAGQHRFGADLDVPAHPGGTQCVDSVGEAYGLTDMGHPVRGRGEFAGCGDAAGHVGDHGQQRVGVGEVLGDPAELLQHRLHRRRRRGSRRPCGTPPASAPSAASGTRATPAAGTYDAPAHGTPPPQPPPPPQHPKPPPKKAR
ncbi:hypothetical protein APS67_006761 [Streptomyces sp. AVP053U2]|nr:hypothetical protein APS67_006761 [Streptomyces sp. AVP053U2]